jgi:hypothetical protein
MAIEESGTKCCSQSISSIKANIITEIHKKIANRMFTGVIIFILNALGLSVSSEWKNITLF